MTNQDTSARPEGAKTAARPEAPGRAARWMGAAAAGLVGLAMAVILAAVIRRVGVFGYTLDDPYIHLSLAETILRGGYGINPGEVASPSSSILYPFLVAGTLALGLGAWGPLAINAVAAIASGGILGRLLGAAVADGEGRIGPLGWLALPVMLAAVHGYALAFTGMEHTLHVLASLGIVTGLARLAPGARLPVILPLAILAAPLLRFEGLALSGAALLVMAAEGRWRAALTLGLGLAALLAAYAGIMARMGLPPLPSSVLVKSGTAAAVGAGGIGHGLATAVATPRAWPVLAGAVAMALAALWPGLPRRSRLMAGAVALACLAHVAVGSWGVLPRYEVYLLAILCAAGLILAAARPSGGRRAVAAGVLLVSALVAKPYAMMTLATPIAAQNIHDQQYQMHRFATDFFPAPVAVNDLGWVSFRNESHVLDLWGLGSEEMRKLAASGRRDAAAISALTARHGTVFAMIFSGWLEGAIPPDWCRIATLRTIRVVTPYAEVDFYLIDPTREAGMRAALTAFAAELPESAALTLRPCPG